MKNFVHNKNFIKNHPDFPVPPSHLAYDAYNNIFWDGYYQSGINVATLLMDLVSTHLDTKSVKIAEWGCGPARIIRHIPPKKSSSNHEQDVFIIRKV